MTYGSFLFPPQIHLEQEDPLNLDKENDKIEVSVVNKSWLKYIIRIQDAYYMSSGTILCPPQIYLEQEDPLYLDKENDKIEESVLNILNANSKSNKTSISALWLLNIKCLFRRGNLVKSSAPYWWNAWWTKPRGTKIFLGVLLYIYFDNQKSN